MRYKHLDIAKGIGISLMVVGHALGMSETVSSQAIVRYIYVFHMPLFFTIYGFMVSNKNKSFVELVKKRAIKYISPYLIWGGIYANAGFFKSYAYILYGSHQALEKIGTATTLWFLPCFFVSSIIFFILDRFAGDKMTVIVIGGIGFVFIAIVLPNILLGYLWGINVAFMGASFMVLGKIIRHNKLLENNRHLLVSALVGIILLLVSYLNGDVNMSCGIYGSSKIVFWIFAGIGSYSVLAISIVVANKFIKVSSYLENIGMSTLGILCIHRAILWSFRIGLDRADITNNTMISLIIGMVSLELAYLLTKILKSIKILIV